MAINPIELERYRTVAYDFDDVCTQTDNPVGETRTDIMERICQNDGIDLAKSEVGVAETAKDVLIYGEESNPRIVILSSEMGGVAIHSFSVEDEEKVHIDKWGDDPDHNGFGEQMLECMFGEDYTSFKDGDVFERHFFIKCDGAEQEYPRIQHNF